MTDTNIMDDKNIERTGAEVGRAAYRTPTIEVLPITDTFSSLGPSIDGGFMLETLAAS